jgi:hypothetical protein
MKTPVNATSNSAEIRNEDRHLTNIGLYLVHYATATKSIIDAIYSDSPIAVAARSKAWTVFARSNTGILGSNPTQGMDVCVLLFSVCVLIPRPRSPTDCVKDKETEKRPRFKKML